MPGSIAAAQWAQIRAAAPQAAATIQRYRQRLAAFLAPASVDAAEGALRQFARWMITDAGLKAIAAVRRDDIEDYKVWLAAQPGPAARRSRPRHAGSGSAPSGRSSSGSSSGTGPTRRPDRVIAGDIPKKPEPLPKFPGDRDAARLMAAARASTDPRDRLVVELLRLHTETACFSRGQFGHSGTCLMFPQFSGRSAAADGATRVVHVRCWLSQPHRMAWLSWAMSSRLAERAAVRSWSRSSSWSRRSMTCC